MADGVPKMAAYVIGGYAAAVSSRTVRRWCQDYKKDPENFFCAFNWGGAHVPSWLDDDEVKKVSREWWSARHPRKGTPNAKISDFNAFLCGKEGEGWASSTKGFLSKHWGTQEAIKLSNETLRKFTISLGFSYESLKRGTFNDKHEDPLNQQDRLTRFMPEYFKYFKASHSTLRINHIAGEAAEACVDILESGEIGLRSTLVEITGKDGTKRKLDMGGSLSEEHDGLIYVLFTHDESCFKAGEPPRRLRLFFSLARACDAQLTSAYGR